MTFVIGRKDGGIDAGPVGELGTYRALDGSRGARLAIDLDGPHAMLVVGKRGYGKSYTLGVLAEDVAGASGIAPVVVDPMGVFAMLSEPADGDAVPADVVEDPVVSPTALDPRSWCALVGLAPESGAGGLVWRAAAEAATLTGMCEHVEESDAPGVDRRAAINHLLLAESWGIFGADGLTADDLAGSAVSVIDVSGLDAAPMNAVARGIAEALYRARVDESIDRLPWLLLDEAHAFFDGVAEPSLQTILTRGRALGVSIVLATQRPSDVSAAGISQSDVVVSHRLTSSADLDALAETQPTYLDASLEERMPTVPGEVVVVDDATETVHAARVRERRTPHGGSSPRASDVSLDGESRGGRGRDAPDAGSGPV